MKQVSDTKTEELFKEWPEAKPIPQDVLFAEWLKIHPGKRPAFWEWAHKKQTGEW